ncbi:hypothetical protein ACTFIW_010814 [Dictyostelium discoideum]
MTTPNNFSLNKYENKCPVHKDYDIRLVCSTCKVVVCDGCIVSGHHDHRFDFINAENSKEIFEEFKNKNFRNLDIHIGIEKELLNESNNLFISLENKHTENVNTITEEFKELSKLLKIIEIDKIKQLVTLYDENKDINTNISIAINDNLNNINLITNKYKNIIDQINIDQIINNNNNDINNNNNNNNNNIEILKDCHQSQLLIKDQNENKINELINQYKNVNIVNNSEKVKNSIKEIFEISNSLAFTNVKDLKKVIVQGTEYFILKNDSVIPNGTIYVAIAPSVKTIKIGSIPNSVRYLILLDEFNVQLTEDMLPRSILYLFVGAIKKPLLKGSIPNSVKYLFLLDGFNQEIKEIPNSVDQLLLFDTPLKYFPYSKSIFKSSKYKQQLPYHDAIDWNDNGYWDVKIEI